MKLLKQLPDNSVDMILCDPPYGTIGKLDYANFTSGFRHGLNKWDAQLPTDDLFNEYERVLKQSGTLILFSNEPYTSKLRTHNCSNLPFIYPLYYVKTNLANPMFAHTAPLHYVEDMSVWRKKYDGGTDPTREYSRKIKEYLGLNIKEINSALGHRKMEHFFYSDSSQFGYPTKSAWTDFVRAFNLESMPGFHDYDWLMAAKQRAKATPTFNYDIDPGKTHISNVFKFAHDKGVFHPTQKPVALLERLIRLYTNAGDLVLDNTMGSGSTGVAAVNLDRDFIGYELDSHYFEIAEQRIKEALAQQSAKTSAQNEA